jgi:hypothetical protein
MTLSVEVVYVDGQVFTKLGYGQNVFTSAPKTTISKSTCPILSDKQSLPVATTVISSSSSSSSRSYSVQLTLCSNIKSKLKHASFKNKHFLNFIFFKNF